MKQRLKIFILFAVLLASSVIFIWRLAVRADRDMRERLLVHAHMVAVAVNLQRVRALSGTGADISSPDYLRLKEQLAAVRAVNPNCRFIYITGRREDGSIFFFVDSEPAGSENESPPGQVYEEASDGLRHVFRTLAAVVDGPVTDRWGTWVTAHIPLTDPKTGGLIAVLGMDIDARDWKREVAGRAALPVGLVLMAIMLMAAVVMLRLANTDILSRQAELLDSKEHLSATLRSIGDGVIACDREGRITSLNHVAESLTGWTSTEAAGRSLEEIFHIINTRTREIAGNPVARVLKNGLIVDLANHTALIARDGTEHQIADSCAPIRDASGAVIGAVLVFRDVTGEYRRREELREERERLEHILSITGTGIDIVDGEFNLHFVDRGWQKIYGNPDGRKCYEYFMGLSEPCQDCGIPRALETKQVIVTEEVLPRENNRVVEVHTIPFQNDKGQWLVAEFNVDITRRKRAEEKLRDSESKFQFLAENMADVVFILDLNLVTIYVSPSIERILGFSPEERKLQKADQQLTPESQKLVFEKLMEELEKEKVKGEDPDRSVNIELEYYHKNGSIRYLETFIRGLRDSNGDLMGFYGASHDVTGRRRAEEEIQKQLSEKEVLLREVHHRMKNNINSIRSLLSLQAGTAASREASAALNEAASRVQSMGVLYDKLLVTGEYGEVSMKNYAEGLIESILKVFPGSDAISVDARINDFTIETKKAVSVGIILNELVTNALKYAFKEGGDGALSIFLDRDGPTVTLTVKDNGAGFGKSAKPAETTGLGLTLVKMLTEQLKGSFSMENENGTKNVVRFKV